MAIEFIKIMEGITMAVTVFMFTTGIPPIMHMYKTKDTRNVSFHIFMMGAIGCLGMFHYGLMMENDAIVFLNAIGSFLQCTYVCLYLILAPYKVKALRILTLGLLYLIGLYYYMYIVIGTETERQDVLGMMSSLVTTVMLCLPALEVIGNIRNKNADGMPTVMLLGGLACSSCWLFYGYLLQDPNIYVSGRYLTRVVQFYHFGYSWMTSLTKVRLFLFQLPNIPGLVITIVKLYVIRLYSSHDKVKMS